MSAGNGNEKARLNNLCRGKRREYERKRNKLSFSYVKKNYVFRKRIEDSVIDDKDYLKDHLSNKK